MPSGTGNSLRRHGPLALALLLAVLLAAGAFVAVGAFEGAPPGIDAPPGTAAPGPPAAEAVPAETLRLDGRPEEAAPRRKTPPKAKPAKPVLAPAAVRFPPPTSGIPLEQRYRGSLDVLGRVGRAQDRAALQRHLRRFLPPARGWSLGGDGGRTWGDGLLDRVTKDRERVTEVEVLPVEDAEASEARRLEQLENLRQRDAVGLLDAIHAGLAWIVLHQKPDGSCSEAAATTRCKELGHSPACIPGGRGQDVRYEIAATALSILALLDFRDQDAAGLFEPYLAKAVQWLRSKQRPDGSFPGAGQLYTSAIALMALGQAAAVTGDAGIRAAVARGLQRFDENPGSGGGFRYQWGNDADLSVTGWVAQAVEAARAGGVEVPPRMETNLRWFLGVVTIEKHRFRYRDRGGDHPSLFPAGMLMGRILLDPIPTESLDAWTAWLVKPGWGSRPPLYTVYYGARMSILLQQSLRDPWRRWSFEIAEAQAKQGANAGAFLANLDARLVGAGPTVQTPFAVLTLEHALYLR